MHRLRRHLLAAVTVMTLSLVAIAPAGAGTVAGLGIEYGDDVDERLVEDLNDELQAIFDESSRFGWLPDEEGFVDLEERLRGCFDEICLLEIASELDATVGLTIEFWEEDEIYEWEVRFYDLLEGELAAEDGGSCALCGRSEVLEQFRASIHGRLVTLDVEEAPDDQPDEQPDDEPDVITEVHLEGIPDDTDVLLDGEQVGSGDTVLELGEGTHQVDLMGDDHDDVFEEFVIDEDSPPTKHVRMHMAGERPELNTVLARGDALAGWLGAARPYVGWSTLVAGTGLTAGSFFLARMHGQPTCGPDTPAQRCPELHNTAALATTTTIVGVLAIVGGATLVAWPWLTDDPGVDGEADGLDDADASEESSLRITPSFGEDYGGISVFGRF